MPRRNLTATGASCSPYIPGEPIHLWDGAAHVGTVRRVLVSDGATRLRLGSFAYADTKAARRPTVRKLMLFEITSFVLTHFPGIAEVRFDLDHRLETRSDGVAIASIRSRLLHSMGAEEIKIIPALGETGAGHFTLEAIWRNTAGNQAALSAALDAAREAHWRSSDPQGDWTTKLRTWGQLLRL